MKRKIITELIKTLRIHKLLIILTAFYVSSSLVTAVVIKATDKISLAIFSLSFLRMIGFFLSAVFLGRATYIIFFIRPQRLTRYIISDFKKNYFNIPWLLNALPVLILMPIFVSAFSDFKTMIPIINPFSWDPTFARWDAAIHLGYQPWQLLHPVFGRPILTSIINFFYHLWFFVLFTVMMWQTFSMRDCKLRMQFFLTFVLSWVLIGTFAATLLSSAGPCYYGRVVEGEDIFQPLMQYLQSAKKFFPVWALEVQETLWNYYQGNPTDHVKGISAMPSMHMSMVMLFVLIGRRYHRITGFAFSVFAVILMIGSVHLGWHYAIDGYLAIILTYIIWVVSGKIAASQCLIPDIPTCRD